MTGIIFKNLIQNAIKYSHKGGEVLISSKKTKSNIEILISDKGVGIKKSNLKKLFNLDDNFRTSGTADEIGSGLGLILCKEFVERNGGSIQLESSFKKGTEVTFSLPVK